MPGLSFCQACNALVQPSHAGTAKHDVTKPLTAAQLAHPTTLLSPLARDKSNAQYFFAPAVVDFVTSTLSRLRLGSALCIGMPSIHEALVALRRSSVLLDLDERFAPFFPQSFAKFNMFNGHIFFADQARMVCSTLPTVDVIVVDPPFGGLVDALAHTLKSLWRDCLADRTTMPEICPAGEVPTMLFFPYFLEARPAVMHAFV